MLDNEAVAIGVVNDTLLLGQLQNLKFLMYTCKCKIEKRRKQKETDINVSSQIIPVLFNSVSLTWICISYNKKIKKRRLYVLDLFMRATRSSI